MKLLRYMGPTERKVFQRETEALKRLTEHPHVVTFYGHFTHDGNQPALCFEYCHHDLSEPTVQTQAHLPALFAQNLGRDGDVGRH
ncbi:hypothetical protein T484DRAFT_1774451 [Baffinella frigidus]|nr:hypothetical protein T484DRAFT_1774451 [Cryptophyta sp. CCMP2293]